MAIVLVQGVAAAFTLYTVLRVSKPNDMGLAARLSLLGVLLAAIYVPALVVAFMSWWSVPAIAAGLGIGFAADTITTAFARRRAVPRSV